MLKTEDFNLLEPDILKDKFYAPGIGNIKTVMVNRDQKWRLCKSTVRAPMTQTHIPQIRRPEIRKITKVGSIRTIPNVLISR